jgi:hypothetical protein
MFTTTSVFAHGRDTGYQHNRNDPCWYLNKNLPPNTGGYYFWRNACHSMFFIPQYGWVRPNVDTNVYKQHRKSGHYYRNDSRSRSIQRIDKSSKSLERTRSYQQKGRQVSKRKPQEIEQITIRQSRESKQTIKQEQHGNDDRPSNIDLNEH